jgi:hypothetical protein
MNGGIRVRMRIAIISIESFDIEKVRVFLLCMDIYEIVVALSPYSIWPGPSRTNEGIVLTVACPVLSFRSRWRPSAWRAASMRQSAIVIFVSISAIYRWLARAGRGMLPPWISMLTTLVPSISPTES